MCLFSHDWLTQRFKMTFTRQAVNILRRKSIFTNGSGPDKQNCNISGNY